MDKYYEAKVLVPDLPRDGKLGPIFDWEAALLAQYGGFHVGPAVEGVTEKWGWERMRPYYVGFTTNGASPTVQSIILAERVKQFFGEEAAYVAVQRLEGPFVR